MSSFIKTSGATYGEDTITLKLEENKGRRSRINWVTFRSNESGVEDTVEIRQAAGPEFFNGQCCSEQNFEYGGGTVIISGMTNTKQIYVSAPMSGVDRTNYEYSAITIQASDLPKVTFSGDVDSGYYEYTPSGDPGAYDEYSYELRRELPKNELHIKRPYSIKLYGHDGEMISFNGYVSGNTVDPIDAIQFSSNVIGEGGVATSGCTIIPNIGIIPVDEEHPEFYVTIETYSADKEKREVGDWVISSITWTYSDRTSEESSSITYIRNSTLDGIETSGTPIYEELLSEGIDIRKVIFKLDWSKMTATCAGVDISVLIDKLPVIYSKLALNITVQNERVDDYNSPQFTLMFNSDDELCNESLSGDVAGNKITD